MKGVSGLKKLLIKIGMNAVIILLLLCVLSYAKSTYDMFHSTPEVNTSTILSKIQELSSLSTLEVDYVGIAEVYDDKNIIVYYIYYNATVRYGIDFNEIKLEVDEENHQFIVHMPEVKYLTSIVDEKSIDYLYLDDSYNVIEDIGTDKTHCQVDLMKELGTLSTNYSEIASENAENAIRAITTPFLIQNDVVYSLVFHKEGVS